MERFEKCDESSRLGRTQIFSVRRHIAATLDHLADKLVLREPRGNAIEGWTSLASGIPERMAVAALLALKNKRTLPLKSRCAAKDSVRNGIAAPGVHVWAPGRVAGEMGECSQDYGDQQNRQNSDWPPAPTLFSFSGKKWQQNKKRNSDDGANEESWRLH